MNGPLNITDQVVQFAITGDSKNISNYTRQILQLSVVDWMVVALAGKDEPVARLTRQLENETGGSPESVVIGNKYRLPARSAAYTNGIAGHALDYDDTHFASLGHPSAVVVPASLAISDKIGTTREKFYTATLIGMELAIRIGIWLGRSHYKKGFHVTPTAGAFGAAMAAAHILDLTSEQTRNAIGITASRASGIRSQFGTMGKPFHAGIASSSGVEAALLAKKGFLSAPNALDGPLGFGKTHNGDFLDQAFVGLGEEFVTESITHKFHACCHGTHATIEALRTILNQQSIEPTEIEKIEIIVNPCYLNICNIERPQTGLETKFSFKLIAALVLSGYDTTSLGTFSDEITRNELLNKIRDRVNVQSDLTIPETETKVKIHLHTGQILDSRFNLLRSHPIGTRKDRVLEKAKVLIGDELAQDLWQKVGLGRELPSKWFENHFQK